MKKSIKTFLAMCLICLSSFAIFGCGAKVEKLEYEHGSMDTTLVVGEELVTTGFKAKATMSDDTIVNLTEKDVDFNTEELDLTTPGNKKLEYSYKNKSDEIDIVVTPGAEQLSQLIYTGTANLIMSLGDELDLTNFSAKAVYEDDTEVTLTADDVTFDHDAVDYTTTGQKYLPFTFQGKTITLPFSIIESTQISSFESGVKDDYNTNKSQFKLQDEYYVVGDMNDFNLRIAANGAVFDEENVDYTQKPIKNVVTNLKAEILKTSGGDSDFVELTDEEYETYFDDISNFNGAMNFSADAAEGEGHVFRLTVTSKYFDESFIDSEAETARELVVRVVSGYNVYDAKGLSLLDNSDKDSNEFYGWDEKKTNEEISLSNNINALILHDDIHIKDSDLPSTLFWSKQEVDNLTPEQKAHTNLQIEGSLKDGSGLAIFHRRTNGDFKFYGNYYTVDSSQVSKCVLDWDYAKQGAHGVIVDKDAATDEEAENEQAITIHSNLILIAPKSAATAFKNVDFNNVYFLGNGARSNRSANSGGHILLKAQGVKLNIQNCIHKDYFIGYFANKYGDASIQHTEDDLSTFRFENCIGSNSFNTLFYVWGARDVKIVDSEFKSAGGPGMVIDHVGVDDDRPDGDTTKIKGFPSYVEIINSTVESYVTGKEAWFATYPVAQGLFTALAPANALFTNANLFTAQAGINKTASFFQTHEDVENAINVVAVVKSDSAQDAQGGNIYGGVVIKASEDDTSAHGLDLRGNEEGSLSGKAAATLTVIPGEGDEPPTITGIPYFESHKTGSYVNAAVGDDKMPIQGLFDMNLNVDNDQTFESFADGDYINVYLHIGMGAVFGLEDTTPDAA